MKLKDLIKQRLREDAHVQMPSKDDDDNPDAELGPDGYLITKRELDPVTGKSTTYLETEPKLLEIAREIKRIRKSLKYFDLLPKDDEHYKILIEQAAKIRKALEDAESNVRSLYDKQKIIMAFKRRQHGKK